MNKKIAIVLIAIIGIGMYALPSTVALFSGQHDFKNIDATGNQIECEKCHGDVRAELGTPVNRATITSSSQKPHSGFECEYCHRIEAGVASGDNAYVELIYTNFSPTPDDISVHRKLVVTVTDTENEDIPDHLLVSNTDEQIASQTTISGNPVHKFSASPCYPADAAGCIVDGALSLEVPASENRKITSLYNLETGIPKDTNPATMYDGFNPLAVTWTATGTPIGETQTINLYGAGSRTVNPGSKYHAASLVSCLECHSEKAPTGHYSRILDGTEPNNICATCHPDMNNQCEKCHYGSANHFGSLWTELAAGGFGIAGGSDTGAQEAHMEFQTTNDLITLYKTVGSAGYSNGACVSCHTHTAVDITYQKPTTYKFDANFFSDGREGVGGFGATNTGTSCSDGRAIDGGVPPCNN